MEKKQFLRHSFFLILFCGLMACQDYSLDHEGIVHDLNPIGKAFMQRLKEAPDWSAGWKEVSLKGEVLPNEAALLYGGGYGWHYVLPLVEGKVIIGLVIYPIVDIGENEGPGEGRLGKPIVRVGLEIIEDVGAGSFLNTNSFNKWKSHNLTVSKEVTEAQYKWGQYAIKNNIVQTRTSKGYYYCYYELEYENYIGDDGNAIIVGMAPIAIQEVFHKIADQMPVRFGVTVYKDYVELTDLTQDMMIYYLDKVAIHFKILNASFKVVYIFGRDSNGNETDEYPDYGDIGGGGSGGNSGGGDTTDGEDKTSSTPILDKLCANNSPLTQAEKESIEKGINDIIQQYPLAAALFDKLLNSGKKITIKFDPNMPKGSIKYNMSTHTLTFLNDGVLSTYGALEDWTHVAQCEIYYADQVISNRNLEFEAKMFCDINCAIIGANACAALEFGYQNNTDLLIVYSDLKDDISQGCSFSDLLKVYYKLGRGWNDPDYQKGIFEEQYPELIGDLFK